MKTKYKYFILIIVTILASILIYNYIEENTRVEDAEDVLSMQINAEKEIFADTKYTINNPKVILNPYKISPLTALIVFNTNDLAPATITVKGRGDDEDITNVFMPSKEHLISVYGLYPDYENTIIVNCSGEEKVLKIKTDKLPSNLKNAESFESDTEDFYFTTSADINGYPIAYDKNGNIRWYLTKSYGFDFTRLSNGYVLLSNSDLMKEPYYSAGLVEMDLLGKIYYEYNIPGGYHYDVYEKTDGNLIAISNDGDDDIITEINRNTGSIVKSFNLTKLLGNKISINSIIYNGSTNSIVSATDDMIVNIDYNTGEIGWVIADKKVSSKYNKYLLKTNDDTTLPINPKAVTLVNDDTIAYINNGSHLVLYKIDNVSKMFEEVSNIDLEDKSNNVNLEYNNGVFTAVLGSTVKEIKYEKVTKVIKTNYDLYSAKATKIYAGDIFMTGDGVKLGTTGITPTVKDSFVVFHRKDDSIFKTYDLKLSRDANRLIVKGTFNKNDNVQIILDNVLSKKTYNVDLNSGNKLSNGKIETSTYINKEGVYGKYYIYLKVNGVNYKLCKYVMMS